MDGATTDCAALDETVMFLSHFKDLPDPRQPGKVTYPLDEILLLCLLAVLAGAECFTEIALFGVKKLEFLRRFRPFRDGTPAHDHLGEVLPQLACCLAVMRRVGRVRGGDRSQPGHTWFASAFSAC